MEEEAKMPAIDPETAWAAWCEPSLPDKSLDSPYSHALVEVKIKGEANTRAMSPLDLPKSFEAENVSWRPMPWANRDRRANGLSAETVFEGRDGHLFHTINSVCEQLFEGTQVRPEGCEKWVELLLHREKWCADRGIIFRHLVIPEHHAIYPDKIPGSPVVAPNRPLTLILRAGGPRLEDVIVYPLQILQEGRSRYETSYPHDVHFTKFGAFLTYETLMRSMPSFRSEQLISEQGLRRREFLIAGDVAQAFGRPARRIVDLAPPPITARRVVKGTSFKTTQIDVFSSDATSRPRLVMFRTSNSTSMFPYLLHHFSRIVAVADVRMFYDLVASERPQVVISEIPERYLCFIPDEFASSSFSAVTGYELPLPD
jgi:hypothetical protein